MNFDNYYVVQSSNKSVEVYLFLMTFINYHPHKLAIKIYISYHTVFLVFFFTFTYTCITYSDSAFRHDKEYPFYIMLSADYIFFISD